VGDIVKPASIRRLDSDLAPGGELPQLLQARFLAESFGQE
jgi:hypothetical protein